ncbi:MAG: CPBP family intramembrane metalloprotease [Candidatus Bathyarchaeia archaeon]|nr:CPBP family intramembrane metalloprotease [Candidatus Bathyarchaeia archaeon]
MTSLKYEGLTLFVLLAVAYSIIVEQCVVWLVRKYVRGHRKGRSALLLVGGLFLTSRVFVPVAMVVCAESSSVVSMGLYFPTSFWVLLATLVAFLTMKSFSLLEDIYRVRYLNKDPYTIVKLYTPENYKKEFLSQVIISGLPEEFLYRGYFLSRLIMGFGAIAGIILSSLYFGIVHLWSTVKGKRAGDKYKALRTFLNGIIYATIFIYFGLIPCVILHICGNLSHGWISKLVLLKLGLLK